MENSKTDPRALLDLHEKATLRRLKGRARNVARRPRAPGQPSKLDWVRRHPWLSLTAAASAGALIAPAPRNKRSTTNSVSNNTQRAASAGKWLVYVRLAKAVTEWLGDTKGASAAAKGSEAGTIDPT